MSRSTRSDWSQWSEAQNRALLHLDRVIPTHWSAMKWHKVRGPTIESLIFKGMVRREYLIQASHPRLPGMPFLTLTDKGLAVKKDYILWHREVLERLGSLPPDMNEIARARI